MTTSNANASRAPAPAHHAPCTPGLRCDFCTAPLPGPTCRAYRCLDYVVHAGEALTNGPVQGSEGDWAACDACAWMVDHEEWDSLARRCMASLRAEGCALPEAMLYGLLREFHAEFNRARL